MSEPYTPSTHEVREVYARGLATRWSMFDRWLTAHDVLVRADEREKCAQIAERIKGSHYPYSMGWDSAERIAAAIRSQTTQEGNRG
jgi:hypothetical protein